MSVREPLPATTTSDTNIGSFTDDGPWTVVPDQMPWRHGVNELREQARARVPDLVRPRRLPPARGAKVSAKLLATTLPWFVRNRKRRDEAAAQAELAAVLRPAFESLGTTFIKLGQLIASAEGLVAAGLVEEFKLCRDRVPAETFAHVRSVIEEDLGQPLERVFAEFDPIPLAAASIAQVHAARLRDGQDVVVKVQRPDIDRIVPRDIATLAWLAPVVERRAPQAAVANLPAYIELFAETIVEELDFRLEAQNMLDIARVLAATNQRSVIVPRPHPELVSRRVLVMEQVRGYAVDDEAALAAAGIDTTSVFRALSISFLEGAMIHGVFHGDLHAGNMVVTADGRPALFDFGITGRFPADKRLALLGLMMASVAQDGTTLLRCFQTLGGFPPHADLEEIAAELQLDELMAQNPNDVSPETMALQMRELMKRLVAHGAKLPKEMYLYIKGMVYVNGAISSLAADVDMFAEIAHIYEHFTSNHADSLAQSGLSPDAMPDADGFTDSLRQQLGVDSETLTLREMQKVQAERSEALRAAWRGPS